MLRKLFIGGCIAMLAVTAIAQHATVEGAEGRGAAKAADNRVGEFQFRAAKMSRGQNSRLEGNLTFNTTDMLEGRRVQVTINMRAPERLNTERTAAQFGGPGVMVIRWQGGSREIQGRVTVSVKDNKPADGRGRTQDVFEIGFDPRNRDLNYRFAGPVQRGDITVFHRRP